MVARWFIVIAVVTTVGVRRPERAAAATVTATTTPYPGIVHQEWTESSIPARLHVVRVDLSPAEITLEATTEADRPPGSVTQADVLERAPPRRSASARPA